MSIQDVISRMPATLFTAPIDERGGFALHFVDDNKKIVGEPLNVAKIYETPDDAYTVYYPKPGEPPEKTLRSLVNSNALIKVDTSDGSLALTKGEFADLNGISLKKNKATRNQDFVSPAKLARLEQDEFRKQHPSQSPNRNGMETFLLYDQDPTDKTHPPYAPPKPEDITVTPIKPHHGKTSPKGTWVNKVV